MSETAIIGGAHPGMPIQLRQLDASGGFDQRALASDPIVHHLGLCLHNARSRPSEMSSVCADHVASALQAYLRQRHNVVYLPQAAARGGLAPWQLRRAEEIMGSRLDRTVPLGELARACQLSPGHFARAFKQATGQPPHRWLMAQRIEKAKQLLADTTEPLVEIAMSCGFADQSHFTRVFSRVARSSPGAWRRLCRTTPPAAGKLAQGVA